MVVDLETEKKKLHMLASCSCASPTSGLPLVFSVCAQAHVSGSSLIIMSGYTKNRIGKFMHIPKMKIHLDTNQVIEKTSGSH